MIQHLKALFMVTAVFPSCARNDAAVLAEAFMVSAPSTSDVIHINYSVNKQKVNECTGRTSLCKMATLYTQQLYPYNCGKLYLQE